MSQSFFSAGSPAKRKPVAIRQPQYEDYGDNHDDDDDQYDSVDGSVRSYEGSDSGSDTRLPSSSRDARSQESRQLGPAPAERGIYGSMGGQATPGHFTRGSATAAHALQQPFPDWGLREPAMRYQDPNVASPGFENSRVRSPVSESTLPNQRSVPGGGFSIPRKPVNKPRQPVNKSGKRILIAVFGMTGTGKTTFIKTLAGEAASQLRTGHGLESCRYFYLQSLYARQLTCIRHSGNRDSRFQT